jgi:hypothetical protein
MGVVKVAKGVAAGFTMRVLVGMDYCGGSGHDFVHKSSDVRRCGADASLLSFGLTFSFVDDTFYELMDQVLSDAFINRATHHCATKVTLKMSYHDQLDKT